LFKQQNEEMKMKMMMRTGLQRNDQS